MSYNSLPRVRPELHLTYSRHAPLNKGVAISSALSHKRGDGGDAAHGCGCSSGVEHNLAKVGVEGSNPFARSKFLLANQSDKSGPSGPLLRCVDPRNGLRIEPSQRSGPIR